MGMIIRFLLVIVFFTVVTPLGMILRCIGIDYLNRSFDKKASSCWTTKVS